MKILHTADWHAGGYTDDLNRLPELEKLLNDIVNIANAENVDMVLVAGDVYDSFVPSADAEKLIFDTLIKLSNNGNRAVVVIAGNHDDPKRLTNANVFANKFNIYLAGDLSPLSICYMPDKNITAISSGKGYIEFKTKNNEEVVVGLLPFPSYYRFKEIRKEGENLNQKIAEWLKPCVSKFRNNANNILISHLLTYPKNCKKEDFENYELIGGINSFVESDNLKTKACYTALGHVHQSVCVSKTNNIYYSGSVYIKYFDKTSYKTEVIIADISNNKVNEIKHMPLNSKKLMVQEVYSLEEAYNFLNIFSCDLTKIIFKDMDYINPAEIKKLRKEFPNLVTISVLPKILKKSYLEVSKKNLSNKEIFTNFVKAKTGDKPEEELTNLFLELMGEITYETN